MEIIRADLDRSAHAAGLLEVLASYAEDPMGGGSPLPDRVRDAVVDGLKRHPTTEILLAFAGDEPVGMAVCFVGFSTFRASRILNVHDLAVVPQHRGRGVGRQLLAAVETRARELGCCKLTLEVLESNERARGLYASFGFGDFAPSETRGEGAGAATRTLFLDKLLAEEDGGKA
jgi:ribosomal protein S18 acetylase RimI-like enzyme